MKKWNIGFAFILIGAAFFTSGYGPYEGAKLEKKQETVTISLAGDCSLGKLSVHGYEGTFEEMYDKNGPGYFFQNVKSIFEADDMTLVNFEGVLTNSDNKVQKAFNIKGKPEYIA